MEEPNTNPTSLPFSPMMHVRPGPVTAAVKKLPGGQHVVIHLEHTTGATSLIVELKWAEAFIAQLQEATGGIVVARPLIQ